MDVGQVLVGNLCQRNLSDIQLGMLDQLQQQVKRPGVDRGGDGVPASLVSGNIQIHGRRNYIIPERDTISVPPLP